ncbi:RNA polymerase sigma factor [Acidobacteria bacterium AB60]|nr:RNA polymerase sigma factor [Acidobacteria bacterium AB60]
MVSMGQSDQAAITAILAGDTEAYGSLVKRHSAMLFRMAYRVTGNAADADDVVQEAFLRAYVKLASFESRSEFGTWVYRIAVHCALDKVSGRRGVEEASRIGEENDAEEASSQVADEAPGPERLALSGEIGAMQEMALRGLSPLERTAFVLRHHEEKSTEEIAAALAIAPNAAKQAVFRAVKKVRQRLEGFRRTQKRASRGEAQRVTV